MLDSLFCSRSFMPTACLVILTDQLQPLREAVKISPDALRSDAQTELETAVKYNFQPRMMRIAFDFQYSLLA